MTAPIEMRPIGHVRAARSEPVDDAWDSVESRIELDPAVLGPDAAAGLDAFSHIEVIFHFDRAEPSQVNTGARHPRGRKDWPLVGILAQRARTGRTASA